MTLCDVNDAGPPVRRAWRTTHGGLLGAALVATALTGCSSAESSGQATTAPPAATPGSGTSTPSSSAKAPIPPDSDARKLSITIRGKTVMPSPGTVDLRTGKKLTLAVTSDVANTVHVHGFDQSLELEPGQTAEVTVTGGRPGVYEVETHEPTLRLLKIAVR